MTIPADLVINWDVTRSTAARLAPPGPTLKHGEAAQEVAELRQAAADSVGHVHEITGLEAAKGLGEDLSDVLVVDRPGWSSANTASFRELLAPALEAALEQKPDMFKEGSTSQVLGSAATGAELGGVLAFLSANVLGQFDPFYSSASAPHGRLLLVAPNIVHISQQLNVDRHDFRLWVCLHEQTHRVQFTAAPWLGEHLRSKISQLSTSTMSQTDTLPERVLQAVKDLRKDLKDRRASGTEKDSGTSGSAKSLLSAIQSPEDREIMSHLTAVMSLLEGHANVVMDAVDSSIVPTVKTIRRRFEDRGKNRSLLERLVRKVLQMEAKAAQYRDGQKFVGHIVKSIGMERFNIIWESPDNLPTEDELHNPDQWIRRVGLH